MPAEPTTPRWLRRTGIVILGLLAVVGLWSLLQQVFPSNPCAGKGTYWMTIGNQGMDLCNITSWHDLDGYTLSVRFQARGGTYELIFQGKDRETMLSMLSTIPRGPAR
jgi:hypothetical protein